MKIKIASILFIIGLFVVSQVSGEIWGYRKVIDSVTTYDLKLSDNAKVYELATIDGITYVSVDSDAKIAPAQLSAISVTLKKETVDNALINKIKVQSTHYELLQKRIEQYIPTLSVVDARYFMLSFYEDELNAQIAKLNLKNPPANTKEALAGLLKDAPEKLPSEITAWGKKQMKDLGLETKSVSEITLDK